MLCHEPMRTDRQTGSGRALLLFNMHRKMIGPVAFSGLERIGRLDAKAAERTVRHVGREFIQHVEIAIYAQIANDAFKNTFDAFYPQTAWDAFAAGFFTEIAAALHGPCNHTG